MELYDLGDKTNEHGQRKTNEIKKKYYTKEILWKKTKTEKIKNKKHDKNVYQETQSKVPHIANFTAHTEQFQSLVEFRTLFFFADYVLNM